MNQYRILRFAILLWLSFCAFGQSAPNPAGSSPQSHGDEVTVIPLGERGTTSLDLGHQSGKVEILSDTRGVDFGPYLNQILKNVRENWYHLVPKCAEMMKGKLAIEFAITKEGKVADMKLVARSRAI